MVFASRFGFELTRHSPLAYLGVAALIAILLVLIVMPIGLLLYGTVSKAPPAQRASARQLGPRTPRCRQHVG